MPCGEFDGLPAQVEPVCRQGQISGGSIEADEPSCEEKA
jgi:hypothetical protein